MQTVDLRQLTELRMRDPHAIEEAYDSRRRRPFVGPSGRLMIIAADHPARGALSAGGRKNAMENRADLLERLRVALSRPGVDGLLAAPDVVEDLLLLGALDDKVVIGSMNRGGLPTAVFEADDRFTAYDAKSIDKRGLDAGKMLLRIDPEDPASADTIEKCAQAVSKLADRDKVALVEPFISRRVNGQLTNDLSPDAVIQSIVIGSALGSTSAYTWLKLPCVDEMERVAAATTLPIVLLGGEGGDPDESFAKWDKALSLPTVRGLTVGRTLLYPPDDDVAKAVDTAVSLLPTEEVA
jgi:DhnA family fructose-bisphosphate aldolase class Ia